MVLRYFQYLFTRLLNFNKILSRWPFVHNAFVSNHKKQCLRYVFNYHRGSIISSFLLVLVVNRLWCRSSHYINCYMCLTIAQDRVTINQSVWCELSRTRDPFPLYLLVTLSNYCTAARCVLSIPNFKVMTSSCALCIISSVFVPTRRNCANLYHIYRRSSHAVTHITLRWSNFYIILKTVFGIQTFSKLMSVCVWSKLKIEIFSIAARIELHTVQLRCS